VRAATSKQRQGADADGGERVRQSSDGHVDKAQRNSEQGQPGQHRQFLYGRHTGGHYGQRESGGKLGQQRIRADPGAAAGGSAGDGKQRRAGRRPAPSSPDRLLSQRAAPEG
jgi:hypothetical protein